ncbi:MAG TPA: hypothetical protein VKD22_15110 [Ramlibacter sp.]|nr:hypothetical protein [Ramlibacter sp.]
MTLISAEGERFVVSEKAACVSTYLRDLLSVSVCAEAGKREFRLEAVPSDGLREVVAFMEAKAAVPPDGELHYELKEPGKVYAILAAANFLGL